MVLRLIGLVLAAVSAACILFLKCRRRKRKRTGLTTPLLESVPLPVCESRFHNDFHTFREISNHLMEIVCNHPEIASLRSLESGAVLLRLAKKAPEGCESNLQKPCIWIQGGLHACEWAGQAVVMYLADALISSDLLDKADVYLLPVFNVPGYRQTWDTDRFMRCTVPPTHEWDPHEEEKMVRGEEDKSLGGVNPNCNFPTAFGKFPWWVRLSLKPHKPGSPVYHGEEPLSEMCCRAVADELRTLSRTQPLKLFIDLHSYGQKWMFPRAYAVTPCPHHAELEAAATAAVVAAEAVHGTRYEAIMASELEIPAGGSALDWVYEELGVRHSYLVELRPGFKSMCQYLVALLSRGKAAYTDGFLLPKEQIRAMGEEVYVGLMTLAEFALQTQPP